MRGSKAAAKGVHALAHLAPLCLHFDINETILLGDPAGGDSYEDSLNKILAKVAFVKPVRIPRRRTSTNNRTND
jgi:hypothetical protein